MTRKNLLPVQDLKALFTIFLKTLLKTILNGPHRTRRDLLSKTLFLQSAINLGVRILRPPERHKKRPYHKDTQAFPIHKFLVPSQR